MNASESLIRETTALDPETRRPCPARLIEKDGAVWLEKTLASGKTQRVLAEPDAGFYRRYADPVMSGRHIIMNHFYYVTSKCNLRCPVCYEGERGTEEPSLDALKKELAAMRGTRILLCGAEPTCREDLAELIRAVNERNTTVLMTNGIRLADLDFTRRLRAAGLKYVTLAVNGLNDEVYRKTNGRALLDIKLKALENLGRVNITTYLSMTIIRGVNENEVRPLIDLARRTKNVVQVRFRGMTEVGNYIKGGHFFMSELTKIVCRNGGIDYDLWLKQQDFLDRLGRAIGNDHIRPRLCAMRAEVDKDMVPLASDRNWRELERSAMERPRLVAELIRVWGIGYTLRFLADSIRGGYRYTRHPNFLRISIRVWPTLDTMDLILNRRCTSLYLKRGERLPFCLSHCRADQ
jgi:pyruvate-formate lyase-activating enzyme